ncbi:MAG TPA: HAMP domain-containing sensor histidine kinase [Bryobacteraceae bacterium]|nr:HAMP domain-containing sensor histidine kinase [Bryobacteraceae bacterium]
MKAVEHKRRAALSYVFIGAVVALCGALGALQYRWIGEVGVAARERLRGGLQASLENFSRAFDFEISTACRALLPEDPPRDERALESEIAARFGRLTDARRRLFARVAIAPADNPSQLRVLDLEHGVFQAAPWPEEWKSLRERANFRGGPDAAMRGGRDGPLFRDDAFTVEIPVMAMLPSGSGRGAPSGRPNLPGIPSLMLRLDAERLRAEVIPNLLRRFLGASQAAEYVVEVLTRGERPEVIYQSSSMDSAAMAAGAAASTGLFGMQISFGPGGGFGGRGRGGRGRGGADGGRWEVFASYRAGSLETLVSQGRARNLAVAGGVLLLMIASAAVLARFTRRAQKLAELQMEFVAGVSHELRTPLAVLHTAGYNLRGKMAHNPEQVQRYGALIQEESGNLTALVERVLQFAGAEAGRLIGETEPLAVEAVIDGALASVEAAGSAARKVEKKVDAGLPGIEGDPVALKQAIANLLTNAAKYGAGEDGWVGVYAGRTAGGEGVEIRVADRGPGIPPGELKHVFDPFFRGRRAIQEQIHGTGLGLHLAKKIIEAHGGTLVARSEPGKGAEFIARIPAGPEAPQ